MKAPSVVYVSRSDKRNNSSLFDISKLEIKEIYDVYEIGKNDSIYYSYNMSEKLIVIPNDVETIIILFY